MLDTLGGFGVQLRHTLLADAVSAIDADPDVTEDAAYALDARQALTYMREVLDDLASSYPISSTATSHSAAGAMGVPSSHQNHSTPP